MWDWDHLHSPEMLIGVESRGNEEHKEREVKRLEAPPPAAHTSTRNRERERGRKQEEEPDQNGAADPMWRDSAGAPIGSSRQPTKPSTAREPATSGRRTELTSNNHRSSNQWGLHLSPKPGVSSAVQPIRPTSSYLPGDSPVGAPSSQDRVYESRRAATNPTDERHRRPQTAQATRPEPPAAFLRTASHNTAPAEGQVRDTLFAGAYLSAINGDIAEVLTQPCNVAQNHMVAGARAMMRYRRSNTQGDIAPARGPTTTVGSTPKVRNEPIST